MYRLFINNVRRYSGDNAFSSFSRPLFLRVWAGLASERWILEVAWSAAEECFGGASGILNGSEAFADLNKYRMRRCTGRRPSTAEMNAVICRKGLPSFTATYPHLRTVRLVSNPYRGINMRLNSHSGVKYSFTVQPSLTSFLLYSAQAQYRLSFVVFSGSRQ